jgi:hypothetical protein
VPKSHLTTEKEWVNASPENPPSLILVGTKCIVGPCMAFPDIHSPDANNEYFVLAPLGEWGKLIEDSARRWWQEKRSSKS